MKTFEKVAVVLSLCVLIYSLILDSKRIKNNQSVFKDSITGIWKASIYSPLGAETPVFQELVLEVNEGVLKGKIADENQIEFKTRDTNHTAQFSQWKGSYQKGTLIGKINSENHVYEWKAVKK